jgi:hypothetical protein
MLLLRKMNKRAARDVYVASACAVFEKESYHFDIRLSLVLFSKIHILNEYSLFFTARILFYSTTFLNLSRSSYSKSILYINYHPYFIIFLTTNFFSLISAHVCVSTSHTHEANGHTSPDAIAYDQKSA